MQNDINKFDKNVEKYSDNPLSKNVFFRFTKKTEKIVTAIYMVTSLIHEDEPIGFQMRNTANELLFDLFTCLDTTMRYKIGILSQSVISIEYLLSLFDISLRMGFISEMNANILRKELLNLQQSLHTEMHQNTRMGTLGESHNDIKHHDFLEKLLGDDNELNAQMQNDIKDIKMSFKKNVLYDHHKTTFDNIPKRQEKPERGEALKRKEQILNVLKDKKSVTMKDLATRITNCTEKTLQRDLAVLIKQGYVEKKGAKRWSRYVYKEE